MITEGIAGLGDGRGGDDGVGDGERFHHVVVALIKNQVVEIGGRTERRANGRGHLLYDVIGGRIVMTHVVPVHQMNFSFLAGADDQVGMGHTTHRIRQ